MTCFFIIIIIIGGGGGGGSEFVPFSNFLPLPHPDLLLLFDNYFAIENKKENTHPFPGPSNPMTPASFFPTVGLPLLSWELFIAIYEWEMRQRQRNTGFSFGVSGNGEY